MKSLGFDTSNYTTSVAACNSDGTYLQRRQIIAVKEGEKGVRQSDAVFAHTKTLPGLLSPDLFSDIDCVGVSSAPRSVEGSYMPCFLVGMNAAAVAAHAANVPCYTFSHQQGHIAAGILSCGNLHLPEKPFYAFHISGGTMELLLVNRFSDIRLCAKSLDITAGQLVDRTGVMLGLPFPCGKRLEELAAQCEEPIKGIKITLRDGNCCLSGFENLAAGAIAERSASYIARFIFEVIQKNILAMLAYAFTQYGNKPVLFVGGVMSNALMRPALSAAAEAYFAAPALSSDNAVGVAWLAALKHQGRTEWL